MNIQEIQDELLRLEYPFLAPDYDPDIERYFYLRNSGRPGDALVIYQTRLKPRYPHDEFRSLLMRCYRSRDPVYKVILAKAYRNLGQRSLERVKRTVAYITAKIQSYNEKDVFSTIRTADEILLVLPKDHYEAQAGIERLLRYAEELNFYVEPMSKAVELIRSYLNQSLTVVEEAISRRKNQRQQELERQRHINEDGESHGKQKKESPRGSRHRSMIDLSAIIFSPAELARIEIPKAMIKPEDQTLAFCIKYWNSIYDTAFEQLLYFYSKKYGTKHHAVYLAIRRGKVNKSRDDEILAAVMSILVTGYYYSIRGDAYLQKKWNAIKLMLQQHPSGEDAQLNLLASTAQPAASEKPKPRRLVKPPRSGKAPKTSPKIVFRRRPPATKPQKGRLIAQQKPAGIAAKVTRVRTASVQAGTKARVKASQAQRPVAAQVPVKVLPQEAAGPQQAKPTVSGRKKRSKPSSYRSVSRRSDALDKPGGSVADRLRELSGRSYDVYQDRFLARARGAIRKIMGSGKGLFFTLPEAAEDLIYNFLKSHYADPYMNWEKSQEKKALEGLGFALDSLIPIIDECYRRL